MVWKAGCCFSGSMPPSGTLPPPPASDTPGFFERPKGRILLFSAMALFAAFLFVFGILYIRFSRVIDARLAGPFSGSINVYTAPRIVAVGDLLTLEEAVARLRRSGYTVSRGNPVGWYHIRPGAIEIFPGPDAGAQDEPGVLEFHGGHISRIVSLDDNTERQEFSLGPALIANLSSHREKRRLVRFSDLPPSLVHAVVSTEDKHFFRHYGIDLVRAIKAAYVDMKEGRKEQGASTITMQLARSLWLDPRKSWQRKFEEVLITMHLEFKLSKQQIFEDYANQVYLGRSGTFNIDGFGEAARVYFGKDVSQLTVAESALLAGMVQRPSYFNPYRYPDRARERRDLVLQLMRDNGYLTAAECQVALAAPLHVIHGTGDNTQMQYFVDLMDDELQNNLGDDQKRVHYVYTTLDPDLQDAAEQAVGMGMQLVDSELRHSRHGRPQVALIALDPHTGAIRALVGGRNYSASQLNHVLAMRQPGSVFKPFVYAAALDTAVAGGSTIFTPASTVDDAPTTFYSGKQVYRPANFHDNYMGEVTLRTALAHSLNNATIQLAQEVGYGRVANLARLCGFTTPIHPTPAMAIGAYDTTPLDVAGAYTVFANSGFHVTPTTLALVRDRSGSPLYEHSPHPHLALDPRVNYLLVNMLEDVLSYGTAAGVRSRGFTLPAAGKTGTSRDGWFAGFTSQLLCIVWVGFDDGHDLGLEGARSALPIWTDFMKRAARFRPYGDVAEFQPPSGIVRVTICGQSGELAGPDCPDPHPGVFLEGTQPTVVEVIHAVAPPSSSSSNPSESDRSTDDDYPASAHPKPAPPKPSPSPKAVPTREADPDSEPAPVTVPAIDAVPPASSPAPKPAPSGPPSAAPDAQPKNPPPTPKATPIPPADDTPKAPPSSDPPAPAPSGKDAPPVAPNVPPLVP